MKQPTTFLYARPRLWCRLFGHTFRLVFSERTYSRLLYPVSPSATILYKECCCCPTRVAEVHGVVHTDVLNFDWLREKFDDTVH